MPSEILGIHQSDIVIRSAVVAAILDLRANPWLLDYVFAGLAQDALTKSDYGDKEIAQAKKWFLATEIPVFMSYRMDEVKMPCISITLADAAEAETTVSDVHYQVQEDNDREWPSLTPVFAPTSYNALTGTVKVPESLSKSLILAPGQFLIDRTGKAHQILEVLDLTTIMIKPGTVADFNEAVIKGSRPAFVAHLESVAMKETYSIGCHVQSEPVYLSYLYSILLWALLRYKQDLLEGRGFERSQISASDFRRNEAFEAEHVFSRHINITGYVRQVWPKTVQPKITGVSVSPLLVGAQNVVIPAPEPRLDLDESWIEQDALTVKLK